MTVKKKRGRPSEIDQELLEELYINQGLSDTEIARRYNFDRTAVVHRRKICGIETRESPTASSGEMVKFELSQLGHKVDDLKETDKLAMYDLLIDDKIRIELISASGVFNNSFYFSFVNSAKREHIESENRIILENGRSKKLFRKTCDFFIFSGMEENLTYFWVIPSKDLPDKMQTLQTRLPPSRSKYEKYVNAWHLLKEK